MSLPLARSRKLFNDVKNKGKDAFIEKKDPNTKRIGICNYNLGKDLMVFTSDETIDEYKKADRISKGSENFDHFLEMQREGLAMPLLKMKFHRKSKLGSNKLFTVNKFTPPPPDAQRLFDRNKDKYNFCTIFKDSKNDYDRYTFKFEPNPHDLSENFETYLFMHHNIAISDVPKTGKLNERFRWARTDKNRNLPYTYTLCMLDAGQPSMVDNMDSTNIELDPQNVFFTLPPDQQMNIGSPHVIANLIHLSYSRASYDIQRTARLDIKIPKDRRNLESESINSVTMDELILITNSVIFKYFEETNRTFKQALENLAGFNFMSFGTYA